LLTVPHVRGAVMLTLRKKIEHLFGDLTIQMTDLEVDLQILLMMVDEVMANLEVDEVRDLMVDKGTEDPTGKSYSD
jgi:hypothetical protein